MLASSALPLAATPAALPSVLPPDGTETAVSADFAALLAQGTPAPAVLPAALAMPPVAPAAAKGAAPDPATPGNILPPALPHVLPTVLPAAGPDAGPDAGMAAVPSAAALVADDAAQTASSTPPDAPRDTPPHTLKPGAASMRPASTRLARLLDRTGAPTQGDSETADPTAALGADAPTATPPAAADPGLTPAPLLAQNTNGLAPDIRAEAVRADPDARRSAVPGSAVQPRPGAIVPPAAAAQHPLPALLTAVRNAPRSAVPAASEPPQGSGQAPAAALLPAPFHTSGGVRLDVAAPAPVSAARDAARLPAAADAAPPRPDAAEPAPASAAGSPVPSLPVSPGAVTLPAAAPAVLSTHDFAVVVDRLAAARESAGLQSVAISVPHADFGRVHLAFRQEDGGLAATLSSSDPDFARIAAQSAPPILPVAEARAAEPAAPSATGRGDNAASTQTGGQTGRGHTAPDRRGSEDGRPGAPGRPAGPPPDGARRSGIFA